MDKLAAIADNRRFLSVPTRELPAVAREFREGSAQAGTVLVQEGRRNQILYLVVEGLVQLTRGGQHLRFVHAGDYFGEERGPVTATALTGVGFLWAGEEFRRLLA